VTERKPAGMSFTSWIDKQILDAEKSGQFDGLPGSGKPIPKRDGMSGYDIWLHDYMEREGVATGDMLPTPLKLKKEIESLAENLNALKSEEEAARAIDDLNHRILQWRKYPTDPPMHVPMVRKAELLASWREAHADRQSSSAGNEPAIREASGHRRWPRWLKTRQSRSHFEGLFSGRAAKVP
jgi:hypothetical protein